MTDTLLVLTECRSALAEAVTLEDVLSIRDKAEAVRKLIKVRGESLAAQNHAAEIKILAERKLGDALAAMDKKRNRHSSACTLQELGIESTASHRWQYIAAVPDKQFAAMVREANDQEQELTSAAFYRAGRKLLTADKPKESGRDSWNVGDWIAHLRKGVEKIYDESPDDFKAMLPNVLRSLAEQVDSWEANEHGSGRRDREDSAIPA